MWKRVLTLGVAFALLYSDCSSCSCWHAKEAHVRTPPVYRVVPSPTLAFARFETPSSECPFVSSTRSGRVAVAARPYVSLAAVASIENGAPAGDVPRFIDLPAHGDAMVLEWQGQWSGALQVRSASGVLGFERGMAGAGSHVLAREEALYVAGRPFSWTGTEDPDTSGADVNQGGELLAMSVQGVELRSLVVNNGLPSHDRPPDPDNMEAGMERLHDATIDASAWRYRAWEPGVGAIDANGHTVVALPSGRLVVLTPKGDEKITEAVLALDAPIAPGATDLSVVPPFALVLYGGGAAGQLVQRLRGGATVSRLDARRPDGSLAWSAILPFVPTQPALDGNGRVYVVGAGIAAFDLKGHLLWSWFSTIGLRGAAFADGTLVVVRGDEVQIVARDGSIRQSFRAAEELTTYPAIAADGAIWVASAKMLYVVR